MLFKSKAVAPGCSFRLGTIFVFSRRGLGKDQRSCRSCHSGFQFVLPHTCAVIMTLLSQISRTLSTVNSPAASGGVQLVKRSLTTSSKMASSGHRIERDTFGKKQGGRKHSNARGSLAKKSFTTYYLCMYVCCSLGFGHLKIFLSWLGAFSEPSAGLILHPWKDIRGCEHEHWLNTCTHC